MTKDRSLDFVHGKMYQQCLFLTLAIIRFLGPVPLALGQFPATTYLRSGYGNNMYGSKTGYFWKYLVRAPVLVNGLMTIQFGGNTCTAIHVNVVSRHGTRYASADEMRAFTTLQNKLMGELGDQSYSFINTWTNKYHESQADLLTPLGKEEMNYLGGRMGFQLRDLLTNAVDASMFSTSSIKFSATRKTRTQESAKFFQNGLAQSVLGKNDTSVPVVVRDKTLRFYDDCKRYDEVTAMMPELTKFQNGPEMKMVRDEITAKLRLNSTMTVDDVKMLWRLCATELAVMDDYDWCRIMTDKHREILEYENDIEDYYGRLYGHPVIGQMACPLVSDVFQEADSAIAGYDSGRNYTKGVFQFGHSDTVVDFAAGLGLFNDNITFRADNYHQLKNRSFNSADVDPFSTHFTFILYNCGGTGSQNYALRMLFNGRPLSFPVCNGDICDYNTVRLSYKQSIDNCDRDGVCGINSPNVVIGR